MAKILSNVRDLMLDMYPKRFLSKCKKIQLFLFANFLEIIQIQTRFRLELFKARSLVSVQQMADNSQNSCYLLAYLVFGGSKNQHKMTQTEVLFRSFFS